MAGTRCGTTAFVGRYAVGGAEDAQSQHRPPHSSGVGGASRPKLYAAPASASAIWATRTALPTAIRVNKHYARVHVVHVLFSHSSRRATHALSHGIRAATQGVAAPPHARNV